MTCPHCRGLGRLQPDGRRCECNPESKALVWAIERLTQAYSELADTKHTSMYYDETESEEAATRRDFSVHTAEIALLQTFIQKLS